MEKTLAFLETYRGRDRVLRLLCYSSKCIAGILTSPELCSQFDNFSSQLSVARTCFRLLDDIPTIWDVYLRVSKEKETSLFKKVIATVENIVDLIFCPVDHIAWAIDHKILISNSSTWDTLSTLCWVISLYISIIKIFLKMAALSNQKLERNITIDNREAKRKLSEEQLKLKFSLTKCLADILFAVNYLPSGMLWAKLLKKWQVGALGSLSSAVSLYQTVTL